MAILLECKGISGYYNTAPVATTLITSLFVMYQTTWLSTTPSNATNPTIAAGAYVNAAGSVLGVLADWLITAAIMHGLSAFLDGRGEFRRTFEFAGYGFLPSLLGSAVTIPISLNYVEKAVMPKVDITELTADPGILAKAILSQIPAESLSAPVSNCVFRLSEDDERLAAS